MNVKGLSAGDVALASLRDVTTWLADGVDRSMRLRVEGRSSARGPAPAWLTASRDVRVREIREGSLELVLAAPSLGDSNPDMFGQGDLFGDAPRPDETPVDVFMDSLRDAINGDRDSDRLDAGLLQSIVSAQQLFSRGALSISFNDRRGQDRLTLLAEHLVGLQALAAESPSPRVVRVSGVLDLLRASTGAFWLKIEEGLSIRGLLSAIDLEKSRALLGERVVVEGSVNFKPSGAPLRIDASALRQATDSDRIWSRLPDAQQQPKKQTTSGAHGISELAGSWPSDETDEQIASALRSIS